MADDSEFICSVVRIVSVDLHPGADRLVLVRFALHEGETYPDAVVAGKDEYQAGDLAVYVSPDSVVPIDHPEFAFLSSRPDGRGKSKFRVRSARLRGLYSPGLLVHHCGAQALGADVSAALGVEKWEPEEQKARWIETAPGEVKKFVPPPDRFPIYSVTSMKKVPALFNEGEPVVITEKIHGTNFRFGYGGGEKLFYGIHRTALTDVRTFWRKCLDYVRGRRIHVNNSPGFGNPWEEAVELFELRDVCRTFPELLFYGELFGTTSNGKKVQDLTYGLNSCLGLRVFDVWHGAEKRWLTYAEKEPVMARMASLGIYPVKVLHSGLYSSAAMRELAEQDSAFGGIREGVVVEALGGIRRKGKWVSQRYHLRKDT